MTKKITSEESKGVRNLLFFLRGISFSFEQPDSTKNPMPPR